MKIQFNDNERIYLIESLNSKLNIYKELMKNREEHRRSCPEYKPSEYQIAIEIKQAKNIEIVKSIRSKL